MRAGEISRNYDDVMTAFRDAFFAKDTVAMDYIEQVRCVLLFVVCTVYGIVFGDCVVMCWMIRPRTFDSFNSNFLLIS